MPSVHQQGGHRDEKKVGQKCVQSCQVYSRNKYERRARAIMAETQTKRTGQERERKTEAESEKER